MSTEGQRKSASVDDEDESVRIPAKGSAWPEVATFALTYNAYARHRGYERVSSTYRAARAEYERSGKVPKKVAELRSLLFFEQRCWNHEGAEPTPDQRAFADAVLAELHERTDGTVPGPPDRPYDRGPQVHRHTPVRRWLIHQNLKRKARRGNR